MKRSEINSALKYAEAMLNAALFRLPEFAFWDPEQWKIRRGETGTIRQTMLGWDITDFGMGNFSSVGAVLFTLRNGVAGCPGTGTPYAEKLICLRKNQRLPLHYHAVKTEDIITRSGLMWMELYNSKSGSVDRETPVTVDCDGIKKTYAAGLRFEVPPGNSVTLRPGLYHLFGAGNEDTVVGEVSSVNDDKTDNYFAEAVSRFADIDEDEKTLRLLCNEYFA